MKVVKVTTKRKVTVPAELRKKHNLIPGKLAKFETTEDGIRMFSLVTSEEIKANIGFLGTGGKLLRALMEEKNREREL